MPLTSKRSPARHVSSSSAAPFVSSASVAGVISAMHTSCGGVGGTAGGGGTEFATRRDFLFVFLTCINLEETSNTQFCPSAASGLQQSYVSRSATLLSNGCIARVAPLPLHRLPEPVRSPHHLASSPVATCSGDECKLLEDLAIHSLCFFCRRLPPSSFSPHLPRILPALIRQFGCVNAVVCLAPTLITVASPRP